jgi:hypothetical protein
VKDNLGSEGQGYMDGQRLYVEEGRRGVAQGDDGNVEDAAEGR